MLILRRRLLSRLARYNGYVQTLDTYAAIRDRIDQALSGMTCALDIGNGGVFDYDPPSAIAQYICDLGEQVDVTRIPKGWWVLQYGVKVPAFMTPICPYRFIAHKRMSGSPEGFSHG